MIKKAIQKKKKDRIDNCSGVSIISQPCIGTWITKHNGVFSPLPKHAGILLHSKCLKLRNGVAA
jgi:hypothetical protein